MIFSLPTEAWATFSWLHASLVFVNYVAVDILYAGYTLSVTRGQPLIASFTSMFIYVLGGLGLLTLMSNWLYLFPLAAGAWLGTYLVVKRDVIARDTI